MHSYVAVLLVLPSGYEYVVPGQVANRHRHDQRCISIRIYALNPRLETLAIGSESAWRLQCRLDRRKKLCRSADSKGCCSIDVAGERRLVLLHL